MRLTDISCRIGDFALQVPDLDLPDHTITGLIGSNGSGKSTLTGIIGGIIRPDSGAIDYTVNGRKLTARERTLVTQQPYLLHDTVRANLVYPLVIRGLSRRERDKKMEQIQDLLHSFHLDHKLAQPAHSLSGGERQKLAFLRALIFRPLLILLDETTSGLDPDSIHLFEEAIRQYQRETPSTWLIVTHQLTLVRSLCDRALFMDQGALAAADKPDSLFSRRDLPSLTAFLSQSQLLLSR